MACSTQFGLRAVLLACAGAVALGTAATAQETRPLHLDIPAEDLGAALNQLGQRGHVEIVFDAALARGKRAGPLRGDFTPDQALDRLLSGTGLVAHRDPSGAEVTRTVPLSERTAAESAQVAELVVTAEKRAERAKDVPISMVVMGNDELKKRDITRLDELAFAVPGLAVQNDGPTTRVTIRGVANIYGNSSLIGLYLDEADVTSAGIVQPNLNTYDLNRVEVLRGPQGTLYGEGSAGGTVRFITNNPDLDRFDASLNASGLYTEDGGPSERVDAMLNAPVGSTFGLRVAGAYDHESGWVNQPAAGKKNINDENLADVRIKALWQPTASLTVTGLAEFHWNHEGSGLGEDAQGNFTQVMGLLTAPRIRDDFDIYNVTATYDAGSFRVVETATYLALDRDTDQFGAVEPLSGSGIPFLAIYVNPDEYKVGNFTEELRFSSEDTGPFKWVVGGFYKHSRLDVAESGLAALEPGPIFTLPVSIQNMTVSDAWSAFGDMNYSVNRLTLGAGARYFIDDQKYEAGPPPLSHQTGDFHSVDPRVYAEYRLSDDANLYASASKGFRSGGFNSLGEPAFGPEDVWTYELGSKVELPAQRLSVDLAIFYSDYRNYQVDVVPLPPAPPVFETLNVGDAQIKGVEWDISWRPTHRWLFAFNGDYIYDRFSRVTALQSPYAVNDPLPLFPNYAFTVSGERDFELAGRPAFVRLDYDQQGKETFRDRTVGPWLFSTSNVITLLNLKVGVQVTEKLAVDVFAQNLLDDRGQIDPFGIEQEAMRERPRTWGIELSAKY